MNQTKYIRGEGLRPLAMACAVLAAALLPGAAAAQAKLYGVLDQGLVGGFGTRIDAAAQDMRHNWGSGNGFDMRTNYTSRLGVEAFETLTPGLRIEARIEGTIDPNHAFSFDRHTYVAVNGDLGSLRIGRTRDLINGIASRVDPFTNDGLVQDKILLAQQAGIGLFRIPNALTYVSPSVDGLQLSVQFALRKSPDDDNAFKAVLTGDHAGWGWHAGIDLPSRDHIPGTGLGTPIPNRYRIGPDSRNIVAGAYRLVGRARIAGEIMHSTRDMDGAGVDPALPRPDASPWAWIATARVPLSAGELKLVMVSSDQVFGKTGAWQPIREIGGGYELFLSKNTMLYLQLGFERKSGGGHWHSGIYTRF